MGKKTLPRISKQSVFFPRAATSIYIGHTGKGGKHFPSPPPSDLIQQRSWQKKNNIKTPLLWQQSYCWTPQDRQEVWKIVPRVRHGWLPSSSPTLLSDKQWFWAFLGAMANWTFWELSSSKCSSLPLLPSLSHPKDLGTELEAHGGSEGKATADSLLFCRDRQPL